MPSYGLSYRPDNFIELAGLLHVQVGPLGLLQDDSGAHRILRCAHWNYAHVSTLWEHYGEHSSDTPEHYDECKTALWSAFLSSSQASMLTQKCFAKHLSPKYFSKCFQIYFRLLLTTSLGLMHMHVYQHLVALDNRVALELSS